MLTKVEPQSGQAAVRLLLCRSFFLFMIEDKTIDVMLLIVKKPAHLGQSTI